MLITKLSDIPKYARIALYGAGRQGLAFYKTLQLARPDIKIKAFVDDTTVSRPGLPPVISVEQLPETQIDFLILTLAQTAPVKQRLHQLGLTIPAATLPAGIDTVQHFFVQEVQKLKCELESATKHLCSSSRPIYGKLLSARIIPAHTKVTPYPAAGRQYLDYIDKESIKTVIEGGVYRGVNTRIFLAEFKNIEHIYGFEPCPPPDEQTKAEQQFVQNHPKCTLLNSGLWDKTSQLWIEPQRFASRVQTQKSSNTSTPAQLTSIDEFCFAQNIKPDFIKLDIEGSEPNALLGAKHTIKTHRPALAISIYHTKHQFYSLINMCASLATDYLFHIGHYSQGIEETVLYAIPNKTMPAL